MGENRIKMQKEKVVGVLDWPTSRCIKDIQKFMGLANYYRHFVKDFAKLARPLHLLVRKDEKWKWEKEQENAFRKLKEVFTSRSILVAPDLDRELRVEADTSEYATSGILSVKCKDERWRPVGFISKSLNQVERNYEIHDQEILAKFRCLEE